jgi:hypothetical protein
MGLKLENQRGPGLGEVGARRIASPSHRWRCSTRTWRSSSSSTA